jgi:hypothetical protein
MHINRLVGIRRGTGGKNSKKRMCSMASGAKWQSGVIPPPKPKRDPDQAQLHRDRVTALITLGVALVVLIALIVLASVCDMPAGSETIDPWVMP